MLHRSRLLPILLAGVGIALIVGASIAPRFLLGDGRLPLDLEKTTWTMHDAQATFRGEPAPVTRQLHLEIQNPADTESAGVRVGDTLRAGESDSDFENLVTAATWSFTMNRVTGQPEGEMRLNSVMGMPDVVVEDGGQWLKFPVGVERRDYDVFDPTLRGTAPARFVGEEEIAGRRVYRFAQEIAPTNVALLYADMRNTKTLTTPEGEPLRTFLFHSATRELTVDQVSGIVVGMNEKVDDFYGDAQGVGVENVVTYDARMSDEQKVEMASQLGAVFSQAQSRAVTVGVMVLGSILTLAGLAGALWPGRFTRAGRRRAGA